MIGLLLPFARRSPLIFGPCLRWTLSSVDALTQVVAGPRRLVHRELNPVWRRCYRNIRLDGGCFTVETASRWSSHRFCNEELQGRHQDRFTMVQLERLFFCCCGCAGTFLLRSGQYSGQCFTFLEPLSGARSPTIIHVGRVTFLLQSHLDLSRRPCCIHPICYHCKTWSSVQ